jgi:probable F420-dependent oxidoreductase
MDRTSLGRVGVWSRELRFHPDRGAAADAAAELEALGYSAVFIPDVGGDILGAVTEMLEATSSIAVATGILNIWMHEAKEVARGHAAIAAVHPGRFALGLGASHSAVVDAETPGRYAKPLSTMRAYLDALDAAAPPLSGPDRMLAALGPKMLELARERSAGAHPYLVTVEHTRSARELLGERAILAPEQGVVLTSDPLDGMRRARRHVGDYLGLPNYVNSFRRMGFGEEDFQDGGSDRLVHALVAVGDEGAIAERVSAQLDAGADHVCIHVVDGSDDLLPREQWRRLAPALVAGGDRRTERYGGTRWPRTCSWSSAIRATTSPTRRSIAGTTST